ncbi:IS110 family transposase, partial [Lactobacillus gigeriorum]|uniref:IS110 family transposase n=1 Tax=Lactobacillus gigeriorum TaxID=1203069 RepID=UPI00058B6D3E
FEQVNAKLQEIDGIGKRKANNLSNSLLSLAKLAYAYYDYDSVQVKLVRRLAQQLIDLEAEKAEIIDYMEEIAPKDDLELYLSVPGIARITALRLIAELGDLRRFKSSNQIDAFVGIDPGRYQSGEYDGHLGISKHGNHIADYYNAKKQSSHSRSYKKIAIASVHKLIRTLYAMIINGQAYDYNVATHNQRL